MCSERNNHVFISYRKTQEEFALQLEKRLNKAGISTWLDQSGGIKGGDDWRRSIQQGLDTCACIIPILSPAYINSKYCSNELARADRLNKPIFPIILELVPETDFPIEIERLQYFDFRKWEENKSLSEQTEQLISRINEFNTSPTKLPPTSPQESYIAWSIDEIKPSINTSSSWLQDPEKIYLPLKAIFDDQNPEDAVTGIEASFTTHQSLLLISGYGTGKSFLSKKLFLNQANAFTKNKNNRIPIYFSLKEFYGQDENLIILKLLNHLRSNGLFDLRKDEFLKMINDGKFLCILDGFDEIPLLFIHSNPMEELKRILNHLAVGKNQILITSRTGVFENHIINGDLNTIGVGYLQPWNDETWKEYLHICEQKGTNFSGGYHNFYQKIAANHSLSQLTVTPLYCQMMVDTENELKEDSKLNLASLYELYINKYLDSVKHRSLIKESKVKIDSLMAIAIGMLEKDNLRLSLEEIENVLYREAQHISNKMLQAFLNIDTLVFSMLITDNELRFSFSHKSFYEFFAALKVYCEICQRTGNDRFSILGREPLSAEMIIFLMNLLELHPDCGFSEELQHIFQNPDKALPLAARPRNPILIRNLLLIQLQITGYIKSFSAEEINLSGVYLQPANNLHCELLSVNFNRSNFIDASFNQVNLQDSSLKLAKCNRCTFKDTDLRNVNLYNADLRNVVYQNVRFNGANFDEVIIHKSDAARLKAALYQEQANYPAEVDDDWLATAIEIIDECIMPES